MSWKKGKKYSGSKCVAMSSIHLQLELVCSVSYLTELDMHFFLFEALEVLVKEMFKFWRIITMMTITVWIDV